MERNILGLIESNNFTRGLLFSWLSAENILFFIVFRLLNEQWFVNKIEENINKEVTAFAYYTLIIIQSVPTQYLNPLNIKKFVFQAFLVFQVFHFSIFNMQCPDGHIVHEEIYKRYTTLTQTFKFIWRKFHIYYTMRYTLVLMHQVATFQTALTWVDF